MKQSQEESGLIAYYLAKYRSEGDISDVVLASQQHIPVLHPFKPRPVNLSSLDIDSGAIRLGE